MLDSDRHAFLVQRWFANKRNIVWDLTYVEWLQIWNQSGKLYLRGRGLGKYCMSRYKDEGPYSISNVYITTNETNNLDQSINERSYFKRQPITIQDSTGNIRTFPSKGQVAKFFGKSSNQMPEALAKGKEYKGWKIC